MQFSKSTANKKAISFYSHHLNKEKLNTIKEFAEKIRILQNHISYIYFDEYFNKHTIKCTDFIKLMNKRHRDKDFPCAFFQKNIAKGKNCSETEMLFFLAVLMRGGLLGMNDV